MRGNPEHGHARAMTVEQAVDEVQIARPATSRADRESSGQMRLRPGGEGGDFLMAHMDPFDVAAAAEGIRDAVEAVADDPIDALDAGGRQGCGKLIGNSCHDFAPPALVDACPS